MIMGCSRASTLKSEIFFKIVTIETRSAKDNALIHFVFFNNSNDKVQFYNFDGF